MPLVPLEPRTALFLLGIVYLAMSGLVWIILRRHHDSAGTALWCLGGVSLGGAYLLFALRGALPELAAVVTLNALGLLGLAARISALHREGAPRASALAVPAATLLAFAASLVAASWGEDVRRPTNVLLQAAGTAWLAVAAHQLGRRTGRRAATFISSSYAFMAATLLLRLGVTAGGSDQPVFEPTLDLAMVIAGGLISGIFGNVGYVGLALEAAQARREAQSRALAEEQAQASALRLRLAERDEFVRVLAHEVRQPLNNASAALQGARAALQEEAWDDRVQAEARLQRAQNVINHIVGTIDNTLAATTVLASAQALAPRDADVNMLIELSLGDLDPAQRGRVRRLGTSHARTAAMDIGLMRLALRNLLANALNYSPGDAAVTLQVSDSDEPLGLVFEVRDRGPGLAPEVRSRVFERGVRGDHGLPGHGLGLYVVRQIMHRHQGQASWEPNEGGGSVFRLWLPIVE
ncbi:HAMP domain-containing sensor histidine kinase [Ideonella sp.]|uniref:ATP-binding protein n=1 Tax=Ideonella sp. TaxID=1929293 RepID=UPI002B4915CC|nr:HAMP domain-containing sensor histidine kinase [Ideonella sp.]HJV67802.1 HAMP domain-containing sensor histidine kinase [Ideonella sp.]